MSSNTFLAEQFESNRPHLRAVAYRMLGSLAEADDAVQEAWLRFSTADTTTVNNLAGWLTIVVGRICLDMLRSRTSRREDLLGQTTYTPPLSTDPTQSPEYEALLADSVGEALLVVLDTLEPVERITFVLHDAFGVTFPEIAPIIGRTVLATRQLASRARRRVRGTPSVPAADMARQREVTEAFLSASRNGDFDALLAVLDPDVTLRGDTAAMLAGTSPEVRGASAVARQMAGRARSAHLALVNGTIGLLVAPYGRLLRVIALTIENDKITRIESITDPARVRQISLATLDL